MTALRIFSLCVATILAGCATNPAGIERRPFTSDEIAKMDDRWLALNFHRTSQLDLLAALVDRKQIRADEAQMIARGVVEIGMSEAAIVAVHGMPNRRDFEWRDELIRSDRSRRVIYH